MFTLGQGGIVVGVLLVLAGLVSLVTREMSDLLPLLTIAPLGAWGVVLLARKFAEPHDRDLVVRLAVAGMLLRLGLALIVHFNVPEWFFAPDQVTFRDVGWRLLRYHRGEGVLPWQVENSTEVGYYYWNALLFLIFGQAPIAPKLVNAFVGTVSGLLAYRLGGELAGKHAARYSLVLTMFFPSLVLWSTLNLRDPIVLLAVLVIFLNMVRLRARPDALSFFAVILGLALLVLFRDYMAVMVMLGILGSTVITRARSLPANLFIGVLLVGAAVFAYQRFGLGSDLVETASFETLAAHRANLATGGTAFRPDADISTPAQGLRFLPVGLAFFLLSPFPWQLGSMLSLMTLPEQLVWYALFPAVFVGGRYLIRVRYQAFGPVLLFLTVTTVVYALVEGNAGTAYRHRAQVLVFFLVVAAVGLALRKVRKAGGGGSRG